MACRQEDHGEIAWPKSLTFDAELLVAAVLTVASRLTRTPSLFCHGNRATLVVGGLFPTRLSKMKVDHFTRYAAETRRNLCHCFRGLLCLRDRVIVGAQVKASIAVVAERAFIRAFVLPRH